MFSGIIIKGWNRKTLTIPWDSRRFEKGHKKSADLVHVSARPTTASNPLWGSPRLRAAPNGFGIQLVIIS